MTYAGTDPTPYRPLIPRDVGLYWPVLALVAIDAFVETLITK
jgi:hypothetical protein